MPRKKKTPVVTPAIDLPKEFLEKLIPGPMDAAGVEAVFQQLKKAVIERALGAELGLHLADAEGGSGNHRNGRASSGNTTRPLPIGPQPTDWASAGTADHAHARSHPAQGSAR